MKHSRPSARVVQAVAAAAVFTGVTALMCISLCSADDFWYSTFLDGGVAQFLELSRYHYEVFNGRVLVHLAAQVILHFGANIPVFSGFEAYSACSASRRISSTAGSSGR